MASELPILDGSARPRPRPRPRRRSRPQRLLLTLGVVLTTVAVAAAAVVGWGAWKLRSIDRTDVALDELMANGPANYLIVGSDSRGGGDPLDPSAPDDHAPLADTIMLLRIDPSTRSARMLSLPRDLWVTLPATGEKGRINAAYARTPQELVDTLRAELDVPINHYVEVDFNGFQQIVSVVEGVPMWFDRAMRDYNTGLDVLHPGCVTLDGRSALAFARSRHLQYFEDGGFTSDGTGDLGRISRQQLFLRRVIDRAKDKGIANPLTLKHLVDVGTSNVTIDDNLSVSDLVALGRQFSSFDSSALQTYTLPNTPRTTDGGAQVVELDALSAAPILDLFRAAAPPGGAGASGVGSAATAPGALLDPAAVTAMVLNSSGRHGLAVEVADELVAAGFEVDHFGNGAELDHPSEPSTVVRYGPGAESEADTVAARVTGAAEVTEDASLDDGAVVLFLGADFTGLDSTASTASTGTTVDPSGSTTTSLDGGAGTSGTAAGTATTAPEQSEVVGMIPGDPPPGKSCG